MELEEAVNQLKDLIKDRESFLVSFDDEYDNVFKKDIQALETAINHITKQEKMIDLMGEFLANLCSGLEVVRDNIDIHIIGDYSATKINKYDKKSIKQYFEKKAEESE